jgi:hypothetical protein
MEFGLLNAFFASPFTNGKENNCRNSASTKLAVFFMMRVSPAVKR